MTKFHIVIKSNCYPDYDDKVNGSIDFRLAVAKVMGDWNDFCRKQQKDDTPELETVTITAISSEEL